MKMTLHCGEGASHCFEEQHLPQKRVLFFGRRVLPCTVLSISKKAGELE